MLKCFRLRHLPILLMAMTSQAHAQFANSIFSGIAGGTTSAIGPLFGGNNVATLSGPYGAPTVTAIPNVGYGSSYGGYFGAGSYGVPPFASNPALMGGYGGFAPYGGAAMGGMGAYPGMGFSTYGQYYGGFPFMPRTPGYPFMGYSQNLYANQYAMNPAICNMCQCETDDSDHIPHDRDISYGDHDHPVHDKPSPPPKPYIPPPHPEIPVEVHEVNVHLPEQPAPEPIKFEFHGFDGGGGDVGHKDETCESARDEAFHPSAAHACPPGVDCEKVESDLIEKINQSSPLVRGARDVLAVYYQDCRVLKKQAVVCTGDDVAIQPATDVKGVSRAVEDPASFIQSHPYWSELCTVPSGGQPSRAQITGEQCKDACPLNGRFNYGGGHATVMGSTAVSPGPIDLFAKDPRALNKDGMGLDCTGFLAAALSHAGLRVHPGIDDYHFQTYDLIHNDRTCFTRVRSQNSAAGLQLLPGDIFVATYPADGIVGKVYKGKNGRATTSPIARFGHAFIFESLGSDDPLGAKKLAKSGRCDVASIPDNFYNNLDFTLIASGANNKGVGSERMTGKDYFSLPSLPLVHAMKETISRECFAVQRQPVPDQSSEEDFQIVRHKTAIPMLPREMREACEGPKKKLKYSECSKVRSCVTQ